METEFSTSSTLYWVEYATLYSLGGSWAVHVK